MAKHLSFDSVRRIRHMYSAGCRVDELATHFRRSRNTITDIVRRRTYAAVADLPCDYPVPLLKDVPRPPRDGKSREIPEDLQGRILAARR